MICESINSNTAFRIHSILYVTAVMMLNLLSLHYPLYSKERRPLLSTLVNIDHTLLDNTDFSLTQILLFGNTTFNAKENTKIISLAIDFVLPTKSFYEPLLSFMNSTIFFFFFFFFCLLPLITILQTTKESYPRRIQDSQDIYDYSPAGSH